MKSKQEPKPATDKPNAVEQFMNTNIRPFLIKNPQVKTFKDLLELFGTYLKQDAEAQEQLKTIKGVN
jgi:hypothetical protein